MNIVTVQIMYFGVIQQSTGEDWVDAKLSLSTAMPSIGGAAPELPTQMLHFPAPPAAATSRRSVLLKSAAPGSAKNKRSIRQSSDEEDECVQSLAFGGMNGLNESGIEEDRKSASPPSRPQLAQPTTQVIDKQSSMYKRHAQSLTLCIVQTKPSMTSVVYEVQRTSTIRSDSAAQKV